MEVFKYSSEKLGLVCRAPGAAVHLHVPADPVRRLRLARRPPRRGRSREFKVRSHIVRIGRF